MSTAVSKATHVPLTRDARRLLRLGLGGLTVILLAADDAGTLLVPDPSAAEQAAFAMENA